MDNSLPVRLFVLPYLAPNTNTVCPFAQIRYIEKEIKTRAKVAYTSTGGTNILWRRVCVLLLPARRYKKLTVGLANLSPWDSAPVWLQYTLCGRYLGPKPAVPTNLTIPCTDVENANRYRYVILQTGHTFSSALCFIEVQVITNGKQDYDHLYLILQTTYVGVGDVIGQCTCYCKQNVRYLQNNLHSVRRYFRFRLLSNSRYFCLIDLCSVGWCVLLASFDRRIIAILFDTTC